MKRKAPKVALKGTTFGDYKDEGHKWITLATGGYYPDILKDVC